MSPTHLLLALLVVLIWGFNFVCIKIGLSTLPPFLFSALRFSLAAVPLVFFVKRPAIPWRLVATYGVIQFGLQFGLLFVGMKLGMPPGLSSLVIQLQAFFTIALAVFLLHERIAPLQVAGATLAILGMVLVGLHIDSRATLIGFALVLAASVAWACANLLTKRMGPVDPLSLVVWASLVAAPLLFGLSFVLEGPAAIGAALQHMDWRAIATVLFNAYPNTIVGFGIWSYLMRRYPASSVAPLALLVPIVGMTSGWLVFDESMPWWKIVAGLCVLVGLSLNQWEARRRAAAQVVAAAGAA